MSKFLKEHRIDLEGALRQQDKDHSGTLQHEEVKLALKEAGLRLTNVSFTINLDTKFREDAGLRLTNVSFTINLDT